MIVGDNKFSHFGVMLDCSRNAVMNTQSIKKWIDIISDLGYNTLMLYMEDTYEVDNEPYFGYMRGRYTKEELREIDEYSFKMGIEFIPAIQTLAHLNTIFRWKSYKDINDCNDILLVENEKTYELIDNMFETLEKTVRTRLVNVGMDEADMLGRGKYQDIHGFKNRFDILLKHLHRVSEIAEKHGFSCIMWGDMFFRLISSGGDYYSNNSIVSTEVKNMIPKNVDLVYWDYYSTDKEHYKSHIKRHSGLKENIWFAGGLWSWLGYAPHNAYSIDASSAALDACTEENVKNVFFTVWGDNGAECSRFSILPSLYYVSQFAKGNRDIDKIKNGFYKYFSISFDNFMLLDLPGTPNEKQGVTQNPEKYMLYNDCLLGLLDSTVREDDADKYLKCAKKLGVLEQNAEYGYLFKTLRTLCEVLAIKYNIGIRIRNAYKNKDNEQLHLIVLDFKRMLTKIDEFYKCLREQWMKENKPFGFEVLDNRLGGLYFRVRHCMERIQSYLFGEISTINELNEILLDYCCNEKITNEPICMNMWARAITAGVLN